MGYTLLDPAADCCRANHLHQRSYGVLLKEFRHPVTKEDCAQTCTNTTRCMFFSWARKWRSCTHCVTCELSSSVVASSREIARHFQSWARLDLRQYRPLLTWPQRPLLDDGALQGDYSVALYGRKDRVPRTGLRLVWLSLLPQSALERLARVGICLWNAMLPSQPFFAPIDIGNANPRDSLWVTNLPTRSAAVPSYGWVEVTHCPQIPRRPRGYTNGQRHPAWKYGPAWLYVAPGSGVSINVGRTRVFPRYGMAIRWLARAVPGSFEHGSHSPKPPDLNLTAGAGELDSVQILENNEYFSREPRHEVIMLRMAEGARLEASHSSVRCGRYPDISQCSPDSAALARIGNCSWWNSALSKPFKALVQKCSWSPSGCYRNGSQFHCRETLR